jgi:hypothetical protein
LCQNTGATILAHLANLFAKPNCRIVKSNSICQIVISNRIAELSNWIVLPNWNAKLNCRIEISNRNAVLSNWICFAESNCQLELPNCQIEFAKSNCWIVKLNSFCRIELPNQNAGSSNWIHFAKSNRELNLAKWFGKPNQFAKSRSSKMVWQTIFRQIYVLQNGLPNLNAKLIWQTIFRQI